MCFFYITFLGISQETLAPGLTRRQARYHNSWKTQTQNNETLVVFELLEDVQTISKNATQTKSIVF